MMEFHWAFYLLLPVIALIFASVGHGGASGYIALMVLFGAQSAFIKPTALVLNLFVAGISFYMFLRSGYFKWKLFYPFAVSSIPAAFIGGYIQLDTNIYKIILSLFMFFSVFKLMGWLGSNKTEIRKAPMGFSLLIGALIGFSSGLIGIGGGIILSPIILLFHWANMKETASISALFIWVNSLAGLSGYLMSGFQVPFESVLLVFLALMGGWLGGFIGSMKIPSLKLQKLLALVLFIAGIKLLFT